jgi:thioredoxin-dependent peroxiredoxin
MLTIGDKAPEFSLAIGGGGTVRLADYHGKKTVVVYFYPKDETAGCTIESCTFRDSYEDFVAAGAEVIGISTDSVASHDRFSAKHRLPFILGSDPDGDVAKKFGVEKNLIGMPGRVTFVIDKSGVVRDAFSSLLRFKTHVSRSLELVRTLEKSAA